MPPTPIAYGTEWWKSNQKKTKRIRLLGKLSRARPASFAWFGSRKSSGDRLRSLAAAATAAFFNTVLLVRRAMLTATASFADRVSRHRNDVGAYRRTLTSRPSRHPRGGSGRKTLGFFVTGAPATAA